ncbi:hypothetical protein OOK60_09605 [Trichothermofontia sichuanensis B231]|uniref:hypothetical protein n=1 Tax=Trichothermofontia sichuanensis TaxID=3045816 RepID=UPI0022478A85|nr:hypothetical protein [Trichothermofontia sichuanensis]UZQ52792.1 hypothetical protein OOK60_09605 [Trichothermofontia sichuanensis B231]
MTSEENNAKRRTLTDLFQQFLLGIASGILLTLIPLTYLSFSALEIQPLYIALMAGLILLCGILAVLLGNKFLQPLLTFLKSISPIG